MPLAGYTAWYDFGDTATLFTDTGRTTPVTTDGDLIKGVTDKSASGFHLSQGTTPPTYKTYIYNGLSVSRWNGTAKQLVSGAAVLAQPFTRCAVARCTDAGFNRIAVAGGGANDALGPYSFSGNWGMWAGSHQQAGTADTLLHVFTYVYNGANSSLRVQANPVLTNTNPGATGISSYEVGSYAGGGQIWAGDICEVLDYPSVLSTADIQSVEAYLITRWFVGGSRLFVPTPFIPQGRSM